MQKVLKIFKQHTIIKANQGHLNKQKTRDLELTNFSHFTLIT